MKKSIEEKREILEEMINSATDSEIEEMYEDLSRHMGYTLDDLDIIYEELSAFLLKRGLIPNGLRDQEVPKKLNAYLIDHVIPAKYARKILESSLEVGDGDIIRETITEYFWEQRDKRHTNRRPLSKKIDNRNDMISEFYGKD